MSDPTAIPRRFVTDILVDARVVDASQVEAALARQRETGRRIGETLVELGFVSEEDIAWALARQLGITFVDVRAETLDPALVKAYPEHLMRRLQLVPVMVADGRLVVAAADPTDAGAAGEIAGHAGLPVDLVSATPSAIARALDEVLGVRRHRHARRTAPDADVRFDAVWERSGEMFLQFHLSLALRLGAGEVHFVQDGGPVHVHHRIGARLVPSPDEPPESMEALSGRLEAFGLPPAAGRERHDCCSGVVEVDGRERPFHASRLVGRHRTSITLRLLREIDDRVRLDGLGLDPVDVARLRQLATEPAGLILVCGPVGSGCSTTLAALLAELPTEERRWLVVARDQRLWPAVPGLVDVVSGPPVARWREVAAAHGADGLVLDGGLEGRRVRGALGSATHGRWVLARSDWEDTFPLLEWLAGHPHTRGLLARRLRAVIQQRVVAVPVAPGTPEAHVAVFEVLFATGGIRAAIREGAPAARLAELARADGFRSLEERIRALRGDRDPDGPAASRRAA